MKFLCLGTSGYQPSETRHTSCYMIPELSLVLDAGTGLFRVRRNLQSSHLDLLLTHAHLDHIVGLTYMLAWQDPYRLEKVRVFGLPKKLEAIQKNLFSSEIFPVLPPIEWIALEGESGSMVLTSGAKVRWWPQDHPGGSLGFRIDKDSHSVAYVTDTVARESDSYLKQLHRVNLLVHECYFDDEHQEMGVATGHSWTSAVVQRAVQYQVGKLALVHTNPYADSKNPLRLSEARQSFDSVFVPNDGDEIDF